MQFDSCKGAAGSWVTVKVKGNLVGNGGATTDVDAAMVALAALTIGPDTGPTGGGTTVTISGTGLSGTSSVIFGGVAVTPTVLADNLLRVVTPTHAAGTVPVVVSTSSGKAGGLTFTYK